jgi:ABC-type Fe3+/spermidine/putrescine transport system ATPase subunit
MLLLEHRLDAGYATGPVVRGVSLEIRPCDITGLIGPSGCGKTCSSSKA